MRRYLSRWSRSSIGQAPTLGRRRSDADSASRSMTASWPARNVEWWIRTIEQGGSFRSVTDVGYVVDSDDRVRLLNSPTARLDFSYALLEQHADFYERHLRAKAFRWMRISVMEKREGNTALASAGAPAIDSGSSNYARREGGRAAGACVNSTSSYRHANLDVARSLR